MINRQVFAEHVREVLAHLYDASFLRHHPLPQRLGMSPEETQQAILKAIRELRPPSSARRDSADWRCYYQLHLRHVEGKSPGQIAQELSIGDRQVRRLHRQAAEVLASVLWGEYAQRLATEISEPADTKIRIAALQVELGHIAAAADTGPTSIEQALAGVLSTIAMLLRDRGVHLDISIEEDPPLVPISRVVVRQILLGLLTYAIDLFPGGLLSLSLNTVGGNIQIWLGQRDHRYQSALIPLRADSTSGTTSRGALSTVEQLAEAHGGSLLIHTARDRYESPQWIRITLPVTRSASILVIDDNVDFLRLFQRFLEDSPYRVLTAKLARDALEMASSQQPDIITLDVMMPTQDGWEVLQELKNRPETKIIPVIVCSVLQEPALAHALGATDFISKPITKSSLISAMERNLPPVSRGERRG